MLRDSLAALLALVKQPPRRSIGTAAVARFRDGLPSTAVSWFYPFTRSAKILSIFRSLDQAGDDSHLFVEFHRLWDVHLKTGFEHAQAVFRARVGRQSDRRSTTADAIREARELF